MDAGQSGVRLRLDDILLPEQPGVRTSLPVIPQLAQITRQALTIAGGTTDALAIGSTALRSTSSAAELLRQVAYLGVKRVALAHDSVTSYLGALSTARGAIVAAGTGVVTLAVGVASVARVDGWGNLIGDAGSGYWIGRAGLDAVMRAHDGRGPATALTAVVEPDFADLEAAYIDLQNDRDRVHRIASYAKTVAALADADEVCAQITAAAAAELARSARTALHRVAEDTAEVTHVAELGKVFLSDRLRGLFESALHDAVPGARVVPSQGNGLDGAGLLLGLPDDSPLRASVSYAQG